jgi:hypothetical protein
VEWRIDRGLNAGDRLLRLCLSDIYMHAVAFGANPLVNYSDRRHDHPRQFLEQPTVVTGYVQRALRLPVFGSAFGAFTTHVLLSRGEHKSAKTDS